MSFLWRKKRADIMDMKIILIYYSYRGEKKIVVPHALRYFVHKTCYFYIFQFFAIVIYYLLNIRL